MRERMKEKVLEVKRNLILEGVSAYFEEMGFYGSTMQDVAKSIGMSVGALYKFFPSKEELFYAYMTYQIDLFYDALLKAASSVETPEEKLILYIRMKFDVFSAKRKAIEDPVMGDPLFFTKMKNEKNNLTAPIFEWLSAVFQDYFLQERLVLDDPMITAYLFDGLTMGYVEYWLTHDGGLEEKAEEVLKRFIHGVKAF